MCLLGIALGVHARYPVVVAANRDEFFHRPAAPAEFWPDLDILAGRDLDKGGTWMGLSRRGSLAAITNFRDPSRRHPAPRSRGLLVRDCLTTTDDAATLAARAVATGDQYDGFNLLVADHGGVWFASNRGGSTRLDAGIHAISNGGL
ncbi:MAG: NRDE family protein, partial [Burkholderiales bacterium]|nr:NRDE family protein [Burkholderiales bacterium]